MAEKQACNLFFLRHQFTSGSPDNGQLSAEARAHVSRQARLKSVRPRHIKFISYFPDTMQHRTDSSLTTEPNENHKKECRVSAIAKNGRGCVGAATSGRIASCAVKSVGWDPFDSFAVSKPKWNEQFMLHYAFATTLPPFGESESDRRNFAQSWMWRTMECPATFHAQVLGASTHYVISCPTSHLRNRIITTGLQCKVQAITSLRSLIAEFSEAISESILLAIFVLAIHESFDLSDRPEPHPLSPLATYRDYHIYGRMIFGNEHINALYYLIQRKGGISNIDQHAFGYVLPIFDLVHCARVEAAPRFPCPRQLKSILQEGQWTPDMEANEMLTTLREGLPPSPNAWWPACLERKIINILQVMMEITTALDHYCRGGPGAPTSLDVLANNCDWVSHTLLSTPSYLKPSDQSGLGRQSSLDITTTLHEICRLCALLYLDMVILPSPSHTGIKLRNSTRLLRLIEAMQRGEHIKDPCVRGFLTWATVLGAIAARFTQLQVPYSDHIERISWDTSWDTLYPRLKRYLWFRPVCDSPALRIWFEGGSRDVSLYA
ncbi:hypothetical protein B0J13DRAFT_455230 [Dactylonectria estremocensis]|uniref:Uncharacterized protein n=1 Tax=Dactylonectria estremocensis TaxID=1079267 RepID=A0A9P9DTV1_9HYPO|nr:hypothetical protein B0J13DRAFT_455230 [Dactylonectria estremocensis]